MTSKRINMVASFIIVVTASTCAFTAGYLWHGKQPIVKFETIPERTAAEISIHPKGVNVKKSDVYTIFSESELKKRRKYDTNPRY